MQVNYEQLLNRSNLIKNFIEEISTLENEKLSWKEDHKQWSIFEVTSHLNQVYKIYLDNFEKKLQQAKQLNGKSQKLKHTVVGRLAIYTNRPKKEKVNFKLKTFDFFEPQVTEKTERKSFDLFFTNKERMNNIIKDARIKDVSDTKIPTALGEKLKFYIPECIDFLLSHEERHVVQIQNILRKHEIQT